MITVTDESTVRVALTARTMRIQLTIWPPQLRLAQTATRTDPREPNYGLSSCVSVH